MRPLPGNTFSKVRAGSRSGCRGRSPRPQGVHVKPLCSPGPGTAAARSAAPAAEQPLRGCPPCAPEPQTSQD